MIEGSEQVLRNLKKLGIDTAKLSADAINATALAIQKDVIRSISARGGGQVYQLGSRKNPPQRTHQASRPFSPPATDQGGLKRSIEATLTTPARLIAQVGVLATIKYAMALEHGRPNVAPRPFLFPALERNKHLLQQNVQRLFKMRTGAT